MEDAWTQMQAERLPPGWEARIEPKTGKSYFINYFTRNASLEDPRLKLITEQMEKLPLQDELRNSPRVVPLMGASAVHSISQQQHNNNNGEQIGGHKCARLVAPESVARVRAMFPTVPETHIKALLIKYHGREAVVISALQVEKHPVATPGPFSQPPPSQPAMKQPQTTVLSSLQRSQLARRTQTKPHSPKMKLRYLKSVFPVVEETILLDTLVNSDNNVTFATQRLITMGFDKRDTPPPPRICLNKKTPEAADSKQKQHTQPSKHNKNMPPEEKQTIKAKLCSKNPQVPERVVSLALDSADYNELTAQTILDMMSEEKGNTKKEVESDERECSQVIKEEANVKTEAVPTAPVAPLVVKTKESTKTKSEHRDLKQEKQTVELNFESPYLVKAQGPNKNLPKGPDDSLLLEDYVTWIGAQRGLAKGPDRRLVSGPNPALRKGPQDQTKADCDSNSKAKWCSAICQIMNWK